MFPAVAVKLSWLERQSSKLEVEDPNPPWAFISLKFILLMMVK